MLQEKIKNLSWTQNLAIIEHYKPTEQKLGEIFGISTKQLADFKSLGIFFKPDPAFDVSPYYILFETIVPSIKTSVPFDREAFDTEKVKKRPGRPGKNIINAFWSVPSEPTDAIEFAKKSEVSLSVLRQSKRFDKTNLSGKVHVRKNKDGLLMIWRDK